MDAGEPLKILIAEDDDLNLELLLSVLEGMGTLIVAVDGWEAWYKFWEEDPSLVFLDMQLPSVDGFTLAGWMKEARPRTAIVGVTAFAMPGDREKVLAAGCDYYLAKPFEVAEVRRLVRTLAGQGPVMGSP
ncbi:response regulator [Thermanaeromonas sp. C210]|uniref:response regulator n=1 Tax=Thermanaeromonas sp. C210 TaxID=2731925 RepID=UPI00155D4220|nr:response regulator [Thermanaeromonas sp. C210]GFN22878.1 response regulator [Thermanaeromonas sp. C210]